LTEKELAECKFPFDALCWPFLGCWFANFDDYRAPYAPELGAYCLVICVKETKLTYVSWLNEISTTNIWKGCLSYLHSRYIFLLYLGLCWSYDVKLIEVWELYGIKWGCLSLPLGRGISTAIYTSKSILSESPMATSRVCAVGKYPQKPCQVMA
jgi:hypothetical protein